MKKTRLLEIIHEEIQIALNEKPIIGGPADIGLENGKVTKQPLSSALKDAIDTIKKEHPDKNEKEIASILVGKKARKSEDTSPEIKEKLKAIGGLKLNEENESTWTFVYKGLLSGVKKSKDKRLEVVARAVSFLIKTQFGSGAKNDFIKAFKKSL